MEIIAEVGLAHDGSLTQAHAYVDAIALAGAQVAKFQCHLGDKTSKWRVNPDWPQDKDRQAYWERTGFTLDQWMSLEQHCEAVGVEFMCSPFSVLAVQVINPLVKRWKVPSGQVTNHALLEAIGKTGKPALLSSGMTTLDETTQAMRTLMGEGSSVTLLQCTSLYPCPPEKLGLPVAVQWGGLSDHSGTIYAGLAAAALGCKVLEVHVVFSHEQGGFDAAASITTEELGELVEGVRFIERALQPVNKDQMAEKLADTRRVFMNEWIPGFNC